MNADFSGERLHHWTCEVMKQHRSYQHLIHAALAHDPAPQLAHCARPVLRLDDPQLTISALADQIAAFHAQTDR
jgi:hypothetical protein